MFTHKTPPYPAATTGFSAPPVSMQQAITAFETGHYHDAKNTLENLLKLNQRNAECLHLLGLVSASLNAFGDACVYFKKTLDISPKNSPSRIGLLRNLARAQRLNNSIEDSLKTNEDILKINPNIAEVWEDQGLLLLSLQRYQLALHAFEQALQRQQPKRPGTLINHGLALEKLGQDQAARHACLQALAIDTKQAVAYNLLSRICEREGQLNASLDWLNAGIERNPQDATLYYNRAISHNKMGHDDQARHDYQRAIELKPQFSEALNNLGTIEFELGHTAQAEALIHKALHIDPNNIEARWNQAMFALKQGDFKRGWPAYETRWQRMPSLLERLDTQKPQWFGQDNIKGKRILVWSEQGLGDTLQFVRYLPMIRALEPGQLLVRAHSPTVRLIQQMGCADVVSEQTPTDEEFDLHIPTMSCPLAFQTELFNIPAKIPYLHAPEQDIAFWAKELAQFNGPLVGIACSGNPKHSQDHHRSIKLSQFMQALPTGPQYILIQKELNTTDQTALSQYPNVHWVGSQLEDFANTAGLVHHLNLIVSIDTSLVHLAGAMGKPVWNLIYDKPDYRWMLKGNNSPWYPSMRLFRQQNRGQWDTVLNTVNQALKNHFDNK